MGQIIGYAKSGHYSLSINWSETINQAANTSTLAISVVFAGNWRVTQGQAHNGTLTINGKSYGFSVPAISWPVNGGSTTLYATSLTIPHAADGTATLTASCVYNCNLMSFADGSAALPNISCSGSQALTTIARASSISSISPNPATIGQPVWISWTPADPSYTYSLFFWVGNYSWSVSSIKPNTTSAYTYSWTAPAEILKAMATSTSLVYGVTLTSYNASGAQLGQYSTTFTEQIAASVAPSISAFSVAASNPAAAASWGFVQGITSPVLSASAAPGTGSTISSYTISGAASGSYSSMPQTLGKITQSGELTYTLTVTDARGRSASKSVKINAAAYSAPTIGGLSVSRISGDDTHAQVSASWNVSPVGGKNSGTATLYWKPAGATSWKTYGTISSGTTALNTSTVVLDEATEYNFRLILTDTAGNSATAEQTVGTAAVLMTWNSSGNGTTFGKISDNNNFNVAWPVTAPQFVSTHGGKWEQYSLHWADGNVYWTKIGTFTMNTSAEKATIRLFFESGYNGQATQHGIAVIHIQKAWQSAASTTAAFGVSYQLSGWQYRDIKVQGRCTESNKLDLYFYTNAEYNSQMSVEITGNYDAFALADTLSTSPPTDGVEQDCRMEPMLSEHYYLMAPDGNWYEPISINGGSTYVGAGTYKAEITDDEIKPSQSYSLALGSSDRPWGRGYIGGLELYNSESGSSVYIDFHFKNSSEDYTDRIIETAAGTLLFQKSGGYSNLTAAAFSRASSRHVKHDISDMPDPTETIMKLRPVSFYYNSDPDGQHMQYGLIAEEVEGVLPSIVTVPDGYKDEDREYSPTEPVPGIDYSKLVPLLLKVVQEQEKRIEALEEKIKEVQE